MLTEIESNELRIRQMGMLVRVCPEIAAGNVRFVERYDYATETLVFGVKAYIASTDIETKTATYHKTWRDGFRESLYNRLDGLGLAWLSRKCKDRWPVEMEQLTVEATVLHPGLECYPKEWGKVAKVFIARTTF